MTVTRKNGQDVQPRNKREHTHSHTLTHTESDTPAKLVAAVSPENEAVKLFALAGVNTEIPPPPSQPDAAVAAVHGRDEPRSKMIGNAL